MCKDLSLPFSLAVRGHGCGTEGQKLPVCVEQRCQPPALSPAQELAPGWGQRNGIGTLLLFEIMESHREVYSFGN